MLWIGIDLVQRLKLVSLNNTVLIEIVPVKMLILSHNSCYVCIYISYTKSGVPKATKLNSGGSEAAIIKEPKNKTKNS